jgi:UV DNA damage endonuclease
MALDTSAKIQIHVGGTYGDKDRSMIRFAERFEMLEGIVKRRLVLENDDRRYSLSDCLQLSAKTSVPVLFDVFHHGVHSSGESIPEVFRLFTRTWQEADGLPMVDYSSQKIGHKTGTHVNTINVEHFGQFLDSSRPYDFDLMLEIKDKELSALKAVDVASRDDRFFVANKHAS